MAKRTLNDRTIRALKPAPAGQRREIWDALVPGLGIRVTDTGAKSFALIARYPGSTNPARRTLGSYGELTLEQARAKAREWIALVQRGIDPAAEIERQRLAEQRKRAGTFASVAEIFIKEKLADERQGQNIERQIRNVFIPAWGERPVTEIEAADVKALVRSKKAEGYATMAHALLTTARRMFSWMLDQGDFGLEHSPCDRIKARSLIGPLAVRQRVLSDDELRAFWRACLREDYPYGDIGRMILLTAARHREVAWAPWSEFDLAKAEWTISPERFKSNAAHIVPLTGDMLALLGAVPRFKSGTYVFSASFGRTATDIGVHPKDRIDRRMLRTLKALARMRGEDPSAVELKPWVLHDLRRTARTRMAALRVPDAIAEMVLGHAKRGLQRVYDQHTYLDEIRSALERWNAHLRAIVEPAPAPNVVALRA